MPTERLHAVLTVVPILAREFLQLLSWDILCRHLRKADDPPALCLDARRQLCVLVDRPALVPTAAPFQRFAMPYPGEAAVDVPSPPPRRKLAPPTPNRVLSARATRRDPRLVPCAIAGPFTDATSPRWRRAIPSAR